jgi:hypothetical protein
VPPVLSALATAFAPSRVDLPPAPATVLAIIVSFHGSRWVLGLPSGALPRADARHLLRSGAVATAQTLARRLCPGLASHHCSLAADLPLRQVRVVVCPGVTDILPAVPTMKWWAARELCDSIDGFLVSCALAATLSFAAAPVKPDRATPVGGALADTALSFPDATRRGVREGMAVAAERLRVAVLASDDAYVRTWADAIGQLDERVLDATPDALLCQPATAGALNPSLRRMPFSGQYVAPATPSYVFPVNGTPPPDFHPPSVRELMPPAVFALIEAWVDEVLAYLQQCRAGVVAPQRGRIRTLVITQEMLYPQARGVVWKSTADGLIPADFDDQPFVQFNTNFLAAALADYPDQELVSFITRGSATKTDEAGLTAVFGPPLLSLAVGFPVVEAGIVSMVEARKYALSTLLPYFPFFAVPQGSTEKGDAGTDRRRTSDGGCPRKPTVPPAMSLNDASRRATWIPEVKPTVGDIARDLAVLGYAASVTGEQVYLISEDFEAFFTQFHRHGSEFWKSGFFWHEMGAPRWVVEYVLGFGLVPSSNIAQRFAHAMMWLLRARISADQAALDGAEVRPELLAYLADRQSALGHEQARRFVACCYTDDTLMAAVGVDLTVCVIRNLGSLTRDAGAALSRGKKLQIGTTVKWNGMYLNSFLGQVIVPPHKALRAIAALLLIVHGQVVLWRVFQSLVGLLEHVRFALALRRTVMYGMYLPFRNFCAREPESVVQPTPATVEPAKAWIDILVRSPGIFCASSLLVQEGKRCELSPTDLSTVGRCFHAFTDSALAGARVASYGG